MQTPPIGILSGTFDPIHLGHIHLATTVQKLCQLQKILLIPCFQSPLRNPPIASAEDRFNMVKLAINDPTHFFADDREAKSLGPSYTIETLKSLHQENIDTPLALIMGIDVFNRFDEWREWQSILEFAHLIIATRPGSWHITNPKTLELLHKHQITDTQQLQKQIAGLIYLADINPLPIAATEIRALIKEHKSASHLVAPDVWQYICKKQLYTQDAFTMNTTKQLTAASLKNIVTKTLEDNKAVDVLVLNIKKLTDIADYMVICTANSTTHVKSLIEKLRTQLALEHIKPIGIEGENTREWMLADFGHVIVHVMLKPIREFYSLEKLWGLDEVKKTRPIHKGSEKKLK